MNRTATRNDPDSGGNFDARRAVVLLGQTTRQARRQFEPDPPWLLVVRALLALIAYGALWLSVRGQHPYGHPTAAVIPVAIAVGIANVIATIVVAKRAGAGTSGRLRLRPAEIALMAAVWVGMFLAMGPMAGSGVSNTIVYGLYPATAPLIIVGLTWAGLMAARADWRASASGVAAAALGIAAIFAGPVAVWAVVGVGIFVLLLARAAAIARRLRA